MKPTDGDLLKKLIEWHNETPTVVRVDVDDPFINEILQDHINAKRWNLLFEMITDEEFDKYSKQTKQAEKDRQIVKKLEDEYNDILADNSPIKQLLQKILEEKK